MADKKKKKRFEYMSTNEWLGDAVTHFMKSGDIFRSEENAEMEKIGKFIPIKANGVKVEYDISYDVPGKICGYKLTDMFTKNIFISPNSDDICRKNIAEAAALGPTEEGLEIMENIRLNLEDKYMQDNDELDDNYPDINELLVLPGTNILTREGCLDWEKTDLLIKNGAYVKLHPITSSVWQTMLLHRWGAKKVIPADAPLYPFLKRAQKVYFTTSSEAGLSSVILNKKIGLLCAVNDKNQNYKSLYSGLDSCRAKINMRDKVASLFSHPESGFVSVYHKNPKETIDLFFEHMKKYPHEIKK